MLCMHNINKLTLSTICYNFLYKQKGFRMAHKFACNISFMFPEIPSILDRYQAAKDAGFKAVESGFPFGIWKDDVVEAKKKADIEQVLINIYTGNTEKGNLGFAAQPGRESGFQTTVDDIIKFAKALDCKKIHIMSGIIENPTSENDITFEKNLRYAVEHFEEENLIALIEPINNITVPNYYMNSYDKAIEIIKKINSPNLKLLLDFFHLKRICPKNFKETFEKCIPYIGHVQISQVPNRDEPDSVGEIDYKEVFLLLEKHGYNDYIGLEYKPRLNTVEGLKWLNHFGFTL